MMIKRAIQLLHRTHQEWKKDHVPRFGAALAFYSIFSLAPLLLIAIAVSGLIFGQEAARGQVFEQLHGLIGDGAAVAIESAITESASSPKGGTIAGMIGLAMLLVGAFGVFGQLQDALNSIWDVTPKSISGFWRKLRERFFSFLIVLGTGFLLLTSMVISAALAAAAEMIGERLALPAIAVHATELSLSFAVITVIFALIFKILPDLKIAWSDVWVGAAMTSLLFGVGKSLIGLYLGHSSTASAYGAAGSLVVLLIWVFYSAQIVLFGAEFTHVYANRDSRSK